MGEQLPGHTVFATVDDYAYLKLCFEQLKSVFKKITKDNHITISGRKIMINDNLTSFNPR